MVWIRTGVTSLVLVGLLAGCGGRPKDVLLPVAVSAPIPGSTTVDMAVATTRQRSTVPGQMFTGERARAIDFANIVVSIPPDSVRKKGDVQWPKKLPGNPATDFVTVKAEDMNLAQARAWFNKRIKATPKRQALVFIHGFNNKFEDAVYRFAQIVHDSDSDVVPILFTWPSRGSVLAYGYDRESNNYSRDALELLLKALADDPNVDEVSILAHSMGNWVTLEALRQMAIRDKRVAPKIKNVMLAAPDVDVDVFRRQMADIGANGPSVTLFVSQDDRALKVSRRVWGNVERLGQINVAQEPFATEMQQDKITVIDLTKLHTDDKLNHAKFAASPEVVQLIGARLAEGQTMTDSKTAFGDRLVAATTGAAATVGTAAGLIVTAPVAIIDPDTRDTYNSQIKAFGNTLSDNADTAGSLLKPSGVAY
ncbi:alpha/beta hydrolase [Kaistia terrae]|uniref:Alpha/beta hydrolase n=1 Tax=Kaistia terrae TaxID=537017 RepID=A0ABW0Q4P2_9HYPH|nr:alpha/beta hydrolase [Kaistia terrae]MCX5581702.1 alpha/beta hydrolase [Kaistia terrae]